MSYTAKIIEWDTLQVEQLDEKYITAKSYSYIVVRLMACEDGDTTALFAQMKNGDTVKLLYCIRTEGMI